MTVEEIVAELGLKVLTGREHLKREISSAYCCDLLSRVMSRSSKNSLWITIQTHPNIVAVAALVEMACIVIPENVTVDENTLAKAEEEHVVILSSSMSAYTVAGKLYSLGIHGA
ncbi:MAG: serine kinase [Firmicutes bacterium]|nr:serine kinase [Bacillota bacterium]